MMWHRCNHPVVVVDDVVVAAAVVTRGRRCKISLLKPPINILFSAADSYIVISVTRLDDFWKLLLTDFLSKVAQMPGDFWNSFKKHHFSCRNYCGYFLGHSWKFLATFYFNLWSHWSSSTPKHLRFINCGVDGGRLWQNINRYWCFNYSGDTPNYC